MGSFGDGGGNEGSDGRQRTTLDDVRAAILARKQRDRDDERGREEDGYVPHPTDSD